MTSPDHDLPVVDAHQHFGAARCMLASNYPVDSLCATYDAIYDGFRSFVADRPRAEQRARL